MNDRDRTGRAAWNHLVGLVLADAKAKREAAEAASERRRLEAEAVACLLGMLRVVADIAPRVHERIEARGVVHGDFWSDLSGVQLVACHADAHGQLVPDDILVTVHVLAKPTGAITYHIDGGEVSTDQVYGALASVLDHWCIVPSGGEVGPILLPFDRVLPESADDVIPF